MNHTDIQSVELLYHPAASLRLRPRTRNNYQQYRNIVYAEAHGVGLVMDVFKPKTASCRLGVIDVVSGGWHADRTMLNEHVGFGLIDALCDLGITVFAVSPGSLPLFTGTEMVHHVHAAIRHIKGYSEVYGVDSEQLGIMGVSAGGHLAALATLSPEKASDYPRDPWQKCDTRLKAAALFFPPSDLLDYDGVPITAFKIEGLDITRLLFHENESGKSESEIRKCLIALSPARLIPLQPPPFMIIQGKKDLIVPWRQAEKLAETIKKAGGEVTLLYNDSGGHLWPGIEAEIHQAAEWISRKISNSKQSTV